MTGIDIPLAVLELSDLAGDVATVILAADLVWQTVSQAIRRELLLVQWLGRDD